MTLNGKKSKLAAAILAPALLAGIASLATESARANDCAAQCYAQENACRRATQGSQSCDGQLTRCLQACRAQK